MVSIKERVQNTLSLTDPNAMLWALSDLLTFLENQIKELNVSKNNLILNEVRRIAETVLKNYLPNLGIELEAKNVRELLAKVNATIDASVDDILDFAMKPTAFGVDYEISQLKLSVFKEITMEVSNVFGLTKEPVAVPLLFARGEDNNEDVKKIREIFDQQRRLLT